jgi:hypothetical protein
MSDRGSLPETVADLPTAFSPKPPKPAPAATSSTATTAPANPELTPHRDLLLFAPSNELFQPILQRELLALLL